MPCGGHLRFSGARKRKKVYNKLHKLTKTNMNRRNNKLHHYSSLAIMFACVVGIGMGVVYAQHSPVPIRVLAYATNLSRSALLNATNQDRSANGQASLTMSSQLNNAAQAKANDMVSKNYWAHTAPDGRQPWDFIAAAGYSYRTAGENLAYGALTSEQTERAWMNSSGHRANILRADFTQVGFGWMNSSNFVGNGEQTVVVAMYASPYSTPAPKPKPEPKPEPKPTPKPAPKPKPAPTPAPTPSSQPSNQNSQRAPQSDTKDEAKDDSKTSEIKKEDTDAEEVEEDLGDKSLAPSSENSVDDIVPGQSAQIRRIQVLSGVYAPWIVTVVVIGGIVAAGVFLYRHSRRWHRWIVKGEQFVVHHVLLDIAILALVIAIIYMLQTVGNIL